MTNPVLLIRANGNDADANALNALGVLTVSEAYLEIGPVQAVGPAKRLLEALETADWLIASSVNGIKFWGDIVGHALLTATVTAAAKRGLRFAAIGAATANALKKIGGTNVVVPEVSYSYSLAQSVISAHGFQAKGEVFAKPIAVVPSGNLSIETLIHELADAGWSVRSEVVYTTAPVNETPKSVQRIANGEFSAVLLRAPSAAKAFNFFVGPTDLPVICGGETTASAARELGLNVVAVCHSPSPAIAAQTVYEYIKGPGAEAEAH
jgi:uroporphyrinogen-III synthase